jgi:hypothetical protein
MDHTFSDGSSMRLMSARSLVLLPVWKGNRIIDAAHVATLKAAVGNDVKRLDLNPYRLVRYAVEDAGGAMSTMVVLVDGQHRQAVLKDWFATADATDFMVVVVEKCVECEDDIIEYFNMLNNVKAITWSEPNMVINAYMKELMMEFNVGKARLIRGGSTRRPYLSEDDLRKGLAAVGDRLKCGRAHVAAFIARVKAYNVARRAEASGVTGKNADIIARAATLNFMLAVNPRLPWISACLP